MGLLQADRSCLSAAQWNLLSNLVHCYDEHSGLSLTERYAREQRTLPLKARFKSDSVCLLISSVFGQAQVLFDRNLDFLSLCSHDRSLLLHRQMKYASIISSTFITRQSGLLDQPGYYQTSEQLFGVETLAMGRRTLTLLDVDIPFLKLALALISFSTFDLTIYEGSPADVLLDTRQVLRIQDVYIELAWRYLVYIYDERRAVICFSNLIRCLFNINGLISTTQEKRTFNKMMDTLVEQTETCLTLNH